MNAIIHGLHIVQHRWISVTLKIATVWFASVYIPRGFPYLVSRKCATLKAVLQVVDRVCPCIDRPPSVYIIPAICFVLYRSRVSRSSILVNVARRVYASLIRKLMLSRFLRALTTSSAIDPECTRRSWRSASRRLSEPSNPASRTLKRRNPWISAAKLEKRRIVSGHFPLFWGWKTDSRCLFNSQWVKDTLDTRSYKTMSAFSIW